MEQRGGHHVCVELEVYADDACHGQGVEYVWLSRLAALEAVGLSGETEGTLRQLHVLFREPLSQGLPQLLPGLIDHVRIILFHFHCHAKLRIKVESRRDAPVVRPRGP